MKKLVSVLVALIMVFAMGTIAFADGTTVEVGTLAELQSAIDNAVSGTTTIKFTDDIIGNVTLDEKVGFYYIIDGADHKLTGTITITPLSDTNDNRRITIKDINFIDPDPSTGNDFINAVKTNHYPRITIEGCSFAGSKDASDVAIRLKSSYGATIKNCTGTGLFLFLHNTSGNNLTIENVAVTDNPTEGGFSLGTVEGVTVKDCDVVTEGYGIRLDTGYDNKAVIEDCDVNAFIPVVVRNATVATTIEFRGENEMTASNDDGIWFAAGKTEYKKGNTTPESPSAEVTLKINDEGLKEKQDEVLGIEQENITSDAAKIGDKYYKTIEEAIAAIKAGTVSGNEIVLLEDVTLSDILVIDKAITLNGNEKTLTSSAARAINVSGADGVTIKNLTIVASGERAINVIQNATNVTIDNVTATAANYTVNVASSAANAVVTVKDSDLTGLNVINVAAPGANVTVDNTNITCNDQNSGESYGALALNKDAVDGTITATNVTFDIKDDSYKAKNGAENGIVTIDGSTDEVKIDVASVIYGDNYYGFATLEGAIAQAVKDGKAVTLLRNIELAETLAIDEDVTIDLNGKKLSGEVELSAKLTIENATEEGLEGLTVKSSVEGKHVVYANGTYSLVEHICADENKDHACDYGCGKVYGEHSDADKDHLCDVYGDECANGKIGEHEDDNKDHACDYGCSEAIGDCSDKDDDGDHVCDYGCGKTLTNHEYGRWVKVYEPTETEPGVKVKTCHECGKKVYADIAPLSEDGIEELGPGAGKPETGTESNPNTGAPVFAPAVILVSAAAAFFKKR